MTLYDILEWIYYLSFSTILIPIIVVFSRWSSVPTSVRWIAWLLLVLLILEIVSTVLRYSQIRNHFIYYFQTAAILWCGAGFFASRFGKLFCYSIAMFVSILIPLEVVFWVGFNHINSATLTLSRALLALGAFILLKQLLEQEPTKLMLNQPAFFLNSGLFVLGFFSLATSAFKDQFIESSLDLYYFFDTLAVMTSAVGFGLLARGFWLITNKRATSVMR